MEQANARYYVAPATKAARHLQCLVVLVLNMALLGIWTVTEASAHATRPEVKWQPYQHALVCTLPAKNIGCSNEYVSKESEITRIDSCSTCLVNQQIVPVRDCDEFLPGLYYSSDRPIAHAPFWESATREHLIRPLFRGNIAMNPAAHNESRGSAIITKDWNGTSFVRKQAAVRVGAKAMEFKAFKDDLRLIQSQSEFCCLLGGQGSMLGSNNGPHHFGSLLASDIDHSPSDPPQRSCKNRDDDPGQGGDCTRVLIGSDESAGHIQPQLGDRFDENAAFFIRGVIGLGIFALAYALLKRRGWADQENDATDTD